MDAAAVGREIARDAMRDTAHDPRHSLTEFDVDTFGLDQRVRLLIPLRDANASINNKRVTSRKARSRRYVCPPLIGLANFIGGFRQFERQRPRCPHVCVRFGLFDQRILVRCFRSRRSVHVHYGAHKVISFVLTFGGDL